MAKIKSYTDLEQSKKLAEILPLESADMRIGNYVGKSGKVDETNVHYYPKGESFGAPQIIEAWSLAALLDVIPTMIGNVLEKDALRLRIDKSETDFNVWYENIDTGMVEEGLDIIKSNPVDACVAMIEKLNELKML